MRAADVMTRDVATVRADTPIAEAIRIMVERRVSGLPVVDGTGVVIGIISEGDLLRRVELGTEQRRPAWLNFLRGPQREAADYVRSHTLRVDDVMTPMPETVDAATPLDAVVAQMTRRGVRRLPVTAEGRLVGVVSRADLVRALGEALARRPNVARSDAEIEAEVVAAIAAEPWSHSCNVTVQVKDGLVTIEGTVFLDMIEAALHVAAERVCGVKGVDVRVAFISPVVVGA